VTISILISEQVIFLAEVLPAQNGKVIGSKRWDGLIHLEEKMMVLHLAPYEAGIVDVISVLKKEF
jgi:hypothetical protein